jgi:hypothetical protein|tara:strand:- start:641 stop:1552 length:912 start_codon:yes stop_codon:yes gene_type:complete
MALINLTKKSLRLLLSRRFTTGSLTTAQEAFTETFDIGSSEVYTQDNLIPTTSLPFSGSSQQYSIYQSSGFNVLKYWYKHRLTKFNIGTDVWFFLNPSGSNEGITPQIIQAEQQTDFVSNKYATPSLANAVSEDATPGYNVVVYKSTTTDSSSLDSGDKVSINDYQFDYKTGVLQFDQNAPSSNDNIFVTAYQYVGRTLDTSISTIEGDSPFRATGSYHSTAHASDLKISGSLLISGSLIVQGQTLMDSLDTNTKGLIISGAMELVDQTVGNAVASASITIENLGTIASRDQVGIIDLGGFGG